MVDTNARGGQPRSVPDPDLEPYTEMTQRQRALNTAREESENQTRAYLAKVGNDSAKKARLASGTAHLPPDPEHSLPDALATGLAKALGSARRARGKWEEGHQVEGAVDAALGLPDLYFDGAVVKGLLKGGGVKLFGPHVWRTPPWKNPGARRWLGEKGFLNRNEPGHHWLIPLNEWGKQVPDFIKNQPWNIKGGLDAISHARIHGPYRVEGVRLPQFGQVRRFWEGTPAYAKAWVAGLIPQPGEFKPGSPAAPSDAAPPPP